MTTNLPSIANAQVPAHIAARMMGKPSALTQAALAVKSGTAVPRISLKQSRFRIIEDGEEFALNQLYLDCIVTDIVPAVSKTFYAKQWKPGDEPTAPDCSSIMGIAPDAGSPAPQSASCATCPKNQWGSKVTPQGTETKACADSRRIAVVSADAPEGTMYLLVIPAASMKEFNRYMKELAMRGIDPELVKTRISFDPTTDYPRLNFTFAGFLDEEAVQATVGRVMSPESRDIVGMNAAPAAQAPAIAAPAAQAPVEDPPTKGFGGGKKAAAPAAEAAPAVPAAEAAPAKGFGGKKAAAAPAAPAAPAAKPANEPSENVAVAGDGIAALEAELEGILGKKEG